MTTKQMASTTEDAHDALTAVLNALRLPGNEGRRAFERAWDELETVMQRHAEEMQLIREGKR